MPKVDSAIMVDKILCCVGTDEVIRPERAS